MSLGGVRSFAHRPKFDFATGSTRGESKREEHSGDGSERVIVLHLALPGVNVIVTFFSAVSIA